MKRISDEETYGFLDEYSSREIVQKAFDYGCRYMNYLFESDLEYDGIAMEFLISWVNDHLPYKYECNKRQLLKYPGMHSILKDIEFKVYRYR